ncbi:hypothetical protein GCM10017083_39030 [Thalassobaculum fulvum]|jgi:hypothetical protein|uniref:Uncharacterized protein n=1 Tax=Thalassobaculum fulvum TaxID=1633335 RepID=A0A919CSD3_9PROT|nr:hypothetical protein [Thalassobaculum fulvum]GHD57471.1 hypothetical protein GCM10017083_39030 [Thalassobaculum fulvum]
MSHDSSEGRDDSAMFGVWPSLVGLGFAALIMAAMFSLATGFR